MYIIYGNQKNSCQKSSLLFIKLFFFLIRDEILRVKFKNCKHYFFNIIEIISFHINYSRIKKIRKISIYIVFFGDYLLI